MAARYPGRIVRRGDRDAAVVRAVRKRLAELGIETGGPAGVFDRDTEHAVRLFQARFTDSDGLPLRIDGEVGPLTWAALFAVYTAPAAPAGPALLARVMQLALNQIGVMEIPPGSNRGPQVDEYLRAAGLDPRDGSYAWCVAFVYWCFQQAAAGLGKSNPMTRTAGVLALWRAAQRSPAARIIPAGESLNSIARIRHGQVFAISTGGGKGHVGLVDSTYDGKLVTIEGNTNDGGSREGIGVFRRASRTIGSINLGFIDYG